MRDLDVPWSPTDRRFIAGESRPIHIMFESAQFILYDLSVLQGRPLYDTPPDHAYFVPPSQWETITRSLARHNNVLVEGSRGIGKTTLLRQLQLSLREREQPVAFVDATAVAEPHQLATRVRDALAGRPDVLTSASQQLHDTLTNLGEGIEPTTVLIDASGSPHAVYGVFGRLRDTVWQLPHHWLVAIDDDDSATALAPPADAFFDTRIALAGRSPHELVEILDRRTDELSPATLAQIAKDARGNPRVAIRAANDALVNDTDPTSSLAARDRLLAQAARLGRPHAMLLSELLDLGQASPSDEKLLDRLGLTRARVNTLLGQLRDAGLVDTSVERSDGPGRPRTVYRPALER